MNVKLAKATPRTAPVTSLHPLLRAGTPLPEAVDFFGRFRKEVAEYSELKLGFRLSLNLGAASFPSDAGVPDGLLEAADTVMYRAKRRGNGGRISFTTRSWTPAEGARSEKVGASRLGLLWVSNTSLKRLV